MACKACRSALQPDRGACCRCRSELCAVCARLELVGCSKCQRRLCRACRACEPDHEDFEGSLYRSACCGRVICADCVRACLSGVEAVACALCRGVLRSDDLRSFASYESDVRAELNARLVLVQAMRSLDTRRPGSPQRHAHETFLDTVETITELLVSVVDSDRQAARLMVSYMLRPVGSEEASAPRLLP